MRDNVLFSWSGGKDSAMALHELRKDDRYEVVALLTTIADAYKRVSHHGVREELLEMQAQAIGVPLARIYLPTSATNEQWEGLMERTLLRYREAGVFLVAHGDIFLQDLRDYRERNLAKVGMRGLFPLWKRNTTRLVNRFISLGFRAYLCCVEGKLGPAFAGRPIDAALLRDLPADVDPCGEYGEFHSFVYAGPIFEHALEVTLGEIVLRDTRYYADLLPGEGPPGGPKHASGGSS